MGVVSTVKRPRRTHFAFGGFETLSDTAEQLIKRLDLILQHYNTATLFSDKLGAYFKYLQLQLGTTNFPLDLDYEN